MRQLTINRGLVATEIITAPVRARTKNARALWNERCEEFGFKPEDFGLTVTWMSGRPPFQLVLEGFCDQPKYPVVTRVSKRIAHGGLLRCTVKWLLQKARIERIRHIHHQG